MATASTSTKTPPIFSDNNDYEVWKKEIGLCCECTDVAKSKQGIAIHLSLTGRARQAISELAVYELKFDDGVNTFSPNLIEYFCKMLTENASVFIYPLRLLEKVRNSQWMIF